MKAVLKVKRYEIEIDLIPQSPADRKKLRRVWFEPRGWLNLNLELQIGCEKENYARYWLSLFHPDEEFPSGKRSKRLPIGKKKK